MADDESFLELYDEAVISSHTSYSIVKIQALCRGWKVRRDLAEIKHLYSEIVQGIDGDQMTVSWPTNRCVGQPTVRRKKKVDSGLNKADSAVPARQPKLNVSNDSAVLGEDCSRSDNATLSAQNKMTFDHVDSPQIQCAMNQENFLSDLNSEFVTGQVELRGMKLEINQRQEIPDDGLSDYNVYHNAPKGQSIAVQADADEIIDNFDSQSSKKTQSLSPELMQSNFKPSGVRLSPSNPDFLPQKLSSAADEVKEPISEEKSDSVHFDPKLVTGCNSVKDAPEITDCTSQSPRGMAVSVQDQLSQLPEDRVELEELRRTTTMELLWVQQAINSRKHYLRLKKQFS